MRDISNLKQFDQKYREHTGQSQVDKHGRGFNKDSRFSSFSLKLSFDNWSGYYGNGGCSTILSLSNHDLVQKAFVQYLNKNMNQVLEGIAKEMESDYLNMKAELESDIEDMQNLLSEISGNETKVE